MLGPVDYALWFLSAFFQATALVCAYQGRALLRYLPLNVYMLATFLVTTGRYVIFLKFGFSSPQYSYFYFFSDAFLILCLYFAVMGLYSRVFDEMGVHRYLRIGALLLLTLTAVFSYQVVSNASETGRLIGRFVVELQQNLYFVGLVLTYLLWVAVMKLRETRTRLIQLIAAVGVFFSAFAANYALHNLAPGHTRIWSYLPPIVDLWLPLAWAYTFARVPEEARLATARVSASPVR